MCGNLTQVLSYLTSLHMNGAAYNTVNIHRSMLSTTFPPLDAVPIGKHPLILSLMRGCYNGNPPRPRYNYTWDPDLVLNHARDRGFNEFLPLKELTEKTVTLLALALFMRVSEIASIEYESICFSQNQVAFSLTRPRKAQRSGATQRFDLQRSTDARCCPFVAVRDYLERTEPATTRKTLFVAVTNHIAPVTASTVGRWIKHYINSAGVDTHIFSAHSTRGAAASKAVANGASIQSVLKAASWTRESTFSRFYHKDVQAGRKLLRSHP